MKLLEINIESINLFKPFLLIVETKTKGVLPFQWYEDEEAWLYDPLGSRINIDKEFDKDSPEIVSVNIVLPKHVTPEVKKGLIDSANGLLDKVEDVLESWVKQIKQR